MTESKPVSYTHLDVYKRQEMDTALNGQVLTSDDKKARRILIEKIDKDGFDETMEEVAYTWFNRFIAIRFMEVNGYMPSHIRVFTSENNEFEPQILSEAIHIDLPGLDKSKVLELYNAGNKEGELFNYLFKMCIRDRQKEQQEMIRVLNL